MTKANARSEDGLPAGAPVGADLAAIQNWLERATSDLAAHGADEARPIDLAEGLAAMAALLQQAVRPGAATHAAAPARASVGPPADAERAAPDGEAAPDAALTAFVEATRRRLTQTFEIGLAAAASETRGLKDAVSTLAKNIEAPHEPAARDHAIEALRRDVAAIAGHLAGAEKGVASLAALEQSIARLLEQMEQARRSSDGEAEAARRLAAEAHERRMAREVGELRAACGEADNRLHLALGAVQETVGRVDGRVARMEADLGAMRRSREAPERAPASTAQTPARNPPSFEPLTAERLPDAAIEDVLIEPGGGFPPRPLNPPEHRPERSGAPPKTRPAAPHALGAGETSRPADIRPNLAGPPGAHTGPYRRKTAHREGGDGILNAHRTLLLPGLAALCLALGAYAMTRGAHFEPPRFLKSIGLGADTLERRSAVEGQYAIPDHRGIDAASAVREPPALPRLDSALLDPAAFAFARKNQSWGAPATRAIAGGAAIMPGRITAHPRVAHTPPRL